MSTYSWSYKTASHRKTPVKKASSGEESVVKDGGQIERDKKSANSLSDTSTGTTKRLNWRAKIYVGNLNKKTNEASLAYYFSVFGDLADVKLIRDHHTNESRGFAFITFEKIESAEKAKKWCSFNYPTLDDNRITVASAERKAHKAKVLVKEPDVKRDPSQTLYWELKWTSDDSQIYGPYETSLMQAWKNEGYFDKGCWVRQANHCQIYHIEQLHELKSKASVQTDDDKVFPANQTKRPKLMVNYSDSEEDDMEEMCNESKKGELNSVNEGIVGYTVELEGKTGAGVDMRDQVSEEQGKECEEQCDEKQNSVTSDEKGQNLVEDKNSAVKETQGREVFSTTCVEQRECYEEQRSVQSEKYALDSKNVEGREREFEQKNVECDVKNSRKNTERKSDHCKELDNILQNNQQTSGEGERETTSLDMRQLRKDKRDSVGCYRKRNEIFICNEEKLDSRHISPQQSDVERTHETKGFNILKQYELEPAGHTESDELSEDRMNEENMENRDVIYSSGSSDDEDVAAHSDKISTEFVPVSEIDFNLFP